MNTQTNNHNPDVLSSIANLSLLLRLFNSALINDAIYKFKRYEDASLEYIGINRHDGQSVGLYDTVITNDEYRGTNL